MRFDKKLLLAASVALLLLTGIAASAAPAAPDDKERVLRRLDETAKSFHSAAADFQFDSVEKDPIYDDEVQKGTVYYERKGTAFQMAAHIEYKGMPSFKVYSYSGGVFKLFETSSDQVTTFSKVSQFESYLMLGFGASGKDLEQKWDIRYLGSENLLDGKTSVKTEKLELVAKDPEVRKYIRKATLWIDAERGVSLKQVFDQGPTNYRVSVYFNFKVNQPLPADAFTFATDSKTVKVNR
jgi:outer membrane lipoprotein-sorting protein